METYNIKMMAVDGRRNLKVRLTPFSRGMVCAAQFLIPFWIIVLFVLPFIEL